MPRMAAWASCALLCVLPAHGIAQDPRSFWQREMAGLERALRDPTISARVQGIWLELASETGRLYPVVPSQQFNMGQALPGGVILLDLSVAGNRHEEVTAFWLAHEYAHQVLGHPNLSVTSLGRWVTAMAGSSQEDAADRWAARFLDQRGYEVEPVLTFLCGMPSSRGRGPHSDGPERAANVAEAYGHAAEPPCEGPTRITRTHNVRVRIWSRFEGNPTTLDFNIDGDDVGSLSNLDEAEVLDLGELTEGSHSFTLSNITIYGPYGVLAGGYTCSGTMIVRRRVTFNLWARLDAFGTVLCGFN